jgi:hypothetical protein
MCIISKIKLKVNPAPFVNLAAKAAHKKTRSQKVRGQWLINSFNTYLFIHKK